MRNLKLVIRIIRHYRYKCDIELSICFPYLKYSELNKLYVHMRQLWSIYFLWVASQQMSRRYELLRDEGGSIMSI